MYPPDLNELQVPQILDLPFRLGLWLCRLRKVDIFKMDLEGRINSDMIVLLKGWSPSLRGE